tara:strand:+ start:9140 stop:9664 length:525 start_codon:yes stop_codon:yes gene_type:complete
MLYPCLDIPDKTINSSLYDLIRSESAYRIRGNGFRTSFTFGDDKRDNESLNSFLTWIESSIKYAAFYFAHGYDKEYDASLLGFNPLAFKINECWGVLYNKGEGVIRHNHFPYAMSFVYYVKMPEGSSPLILDDEEILLPEGRVIFFLGHQFHSVPPTSVNDRCIIAGNILYNFQ